MYYISYTQGLEKQTGYEIKIGPPPELAGFFRRGGGYPLALLPHRI